MGFMSHGVQVVKYHRYLLKKQRKTLKKMGDSYGLSVEGHLPDAPVLPHNWERVLQDIALIKKQERRNWFWAILCTLLILAGIGSLFF